MQPSIFLTKLRNVNTGPKQTLNPGQGWGWGWGGGSETKGGQVPVRTGGAWLSPPAPVQARVYPWAPGTRTPTPVRPRAPFPTPLKALLLAQIWLQPAVGVGWGGGGGERTEQELKLCILEGLSLTTV